MKTLKNIILLITLAGLVVASGCNKNEYSEDSQYTDIGVCDKSLFEIVEEQGVVRIHIKLKIEDYTSEHNLTEDEIERQRERISKLQEEFIKSLEGMDVTIGRTGKIRPWLSMRGVDKEALIFICKSKMVESVQDISEPDEFLN